MKTASVAEQGGPASAHVVGQLPAVVRTAWVLPLTAFPSLLLSFPALSPQATWSLLFRAFSGRIVRCVMGDVVHLRLPLGAPKGSAGAEGLRRRSDESERSVPPLTFRSTLSLVITLPASPSSHAGQMGSACFGSLPAQEPWHKGGSRRDPPSERRQLGFALTLDISVP